MQASCVKNTEIAQRRLSSRNKQQTTVGKYLRISLMPGMFSTLIFSVRVFEANISARIIEVLPQLYFDLFLFAF